MQNNREINLPSGFKIRYFDPKRDANPGCRSEVDLSRIIIETPEGITFLIEAQRSVGLTFNTWPWTAPVTNEDQHTDITWPLVSLIEAANLVIDSHCIPGGAFRARYGDGVQPITELSNALSDLYDATRE